MVTFDFAKEVRANAKGVSKKPKFPPCVHLKLHSSELTRTRDFIKVNSNFYDFVCHLKPDNVYVCVLKLTYPKTNLRRMVPLLGKGLHFGECVCVWGGGRGEDVR